MSMADLKAGESLGVKVKYSLQQRIKRSISLINSMRIRKGLAHIQIVSPNQVPSIKGKSSVISVED